MNRMGKEGSEFAVLLVDISGSTALYERIGTPQAIEQVSLCLETLRQVIDSHGGEFIHSKGDDILCIFETADSALDAAIEMLDRVRKGPLSVHSGIDYGPLVRARGDVFGDSVNLAARLMALANSGEFLCSEAFYRQLGTAEQAKLQFLDKRRFKGKAETTDIYSYADAEPGQETQLITVQSLKSQNKTSEAATTDAVYVELVYNGRVSLCTANKDLAIGRSADCDVIVSKPWVSRNHAALEIRQDHVYLKDVSSSGTYICFDGQAPILVRRETVLLPNSCGISLAKRPDDTEAEILECKILPVS